MFNVVLALAPNLDDQELMIIAHFDARGAIDAKANTERLTAKPLPPATSPIRSASGAWRLSSGRLRAGLLFAKESFREASLILEEAQAFLALTDD